MAQPGQTSELPAPRRGWGASPAPGRQREPLDPIPRRGQGVPTSSDVPLSACREAIPWRPEFHLDLISFCAGNLMDSLTLRDEAPAGPG